MKIRNQWRRFSRSLASAVMSKGFTGLDIAPGLLVVYSAGKSKRRTLDFLEFYPGCAYREPNVCRLFTASMWPGAAAQRWV